MTIKLNGSSSGSVAINAPATTAGGADRTLTLPDKTATISPRMVLERFLTPCDGSTIATANGNITVGTVTGVQLLTETHADVTGSSITYTPPTGTTQVIYEFHFFNGGTDASSLQYTKLMLAGVEVTNARRSFYNVNDYDNSTNNCITWAFNIGGSAVAATGRVASWTSGKEIKIMSREHTSSMEAKIHECRYWDGSDSPYFAQPLIGITAIG